MRQSCWWCWCGRSCSGKAGRQRGELAGVLRSGGVLRRGSEENAKEREEWISGAFCKARARARRRRWPLQRARHRGGEVAAARAALRSAGARGRARKGTARWQRAVGKLRSDAWASRQEVAWGGSSPRRAGGALHSGGGENRGRSWRKGKKSYFVISENSRDQTVK